MTRFRLGVTVVLGSAVWGLAACTAPSVPTRYMGTALVLTALVEPQAPVPVVAATASAPQGTGSGTSQPAAPAPASASGGGAAGGAAPTAQPTPAPVLTLAGAGEGGFADEAGRAARFNMPAGVGVDGDGNVVVADRLNHRIRLVAPDGAVSTLAGTGEPGFSDGPGASARFDEPRGLVVAPDGTIYVADAWNHRIRRIVRAADGAVTVTTVAGTDQAGSRDGDAATARLDHPAGLALGSAGELYVTDVYAQTIRKLVVTPGGALVSTVAGSPYAVGHLDGTGADARFLLPTAIAQGADGNLYVVEEDGCYMRRVSPAGAVSTLIGVPTGACGYADGSLNGAAFDSAQGLAADAEGSLYMADTHNGVIRRLDLLAAGGPVFSTVAGAGPGDLDGGLAEARFSLPVGLAIGGAHLYVTQAHAVRRVSLQAF